MSDRLEKYIRSLTDEERLLYCRKQINTVISDFRRKEKSISAEFNYSGCRTGIRGGRQTSLAARSVVNTQSYFKSVEDLKTLVKLL